MTAELLAPLSTDTLELLQSILNNIIKFPDDVKVRKLRTTNAKVAEKVVKFPTAVSFLESCGFQTVDTLMSLNQPDFDVLKKNLQLVQKQLHADDDYYDTQLHVAAREGDIDEVKKLLDQGASINKKATLVDGDTTFTDATPIFCSVSTQKHEITHLLLQKGANPNVSVKTSLKGYSFVSSPLFGACMTGDVASVKSLLSNGANPNYKTNFLTMVDVTPLHICCMTPVGQTFPGFTIGRLLLENGANVDAVVTKIDDGRSGTSLHWAVVNLKADIRWVTLFLQHNANVNQLDNEGNSALHLLAADEDFSENDAAIATMLLEKGADASLLDNEGKTALQLAVEAKNDALLHVLNA